MLMKILINEFYYDYNSAEVTLNINYLNLYSNKFKIYFSIHYSMNGEGKNE